jgi:hypothetical protein
MNEDPMQSAAPHAASSGDVGRAAKEHWRPADTYDRQEIRDVMRIGAVDRLTAPLRGPPR